MDKETLAALAKVAGEAAAAAVAPVAAELKETRDALRAIKATGNMTGAPVGGSTGTSTALPEAGDPDVAPLTHYQVGDDEAKGKGIRVVRMLKAMATAKMHGGKDAIQILKAQGYRTEAKALSSLNLTGGAQLIHHEYAAELIPMLRNLAVIRKAGARTFPMGASIEFDRQSTAGTAYYGRSIDNTAITESEQALDALRMSEKKLTALTAVPNDLIRSASVSAEEFVRDDLLQVMALREDLAFIRGTGTDGTPMGLRYQAHSDNIYVETMTTEGSPTLAEAKAELIKARKKLRRANIPLINPVWLMASNGEAGLMALAGPGGDGTNVLEAEYSQKGTLYKIPVFITEQIPTNLGGGTDESELYLVDMHYAMIGESMNLELEVFPNGTWDSSGTVKSGISNDMTVIRAIAKHDFGLRQSKAAVVVTEFSWGYA